jgi:ribosomal protein S18 acetylase RimI-like enzyme
MAFCPILLSGMSVGLAKQTANDRSVFLVAAHRASELAQAEHLVAFVIATIETEIPIYRLKEFGFIHDLWVEPDYRQLGLGRQLVDRTLQEFRHKKIQQIRLDTAIATKMHVACFSHVGSA